MGGTEYMFAPNTEVDIELCWHTKKHCLDGALFCCVEVVPDRFSATCQTYKFRVLPGA